MRIAFLLFSAYTVGGTERAAITQANALADLGHDVTLLSVVRATEEPHYDVDDRVTLRPLVDTRGEAPSLVETPTPADPARLHAAESVLVPARWDRQFSALTDVAMEAALRALDCDVVVTVTPALLASAVDLLPDRVVVVHQEHRSSSQRTSGMEPLLAYAPRADVVALLTPTIESWLCEELEPVAPRTVVMPNALPQGVAPRSLLDSKTIVTAGRLVMEKQFSKLVSAFADIADEIPEWRLRILGAGHQRPHLVRETRKHGLYDRVELPGAATDMRSEWAKASICALSSRAEGFPLVLQEAMAAGVPCVSFDCASGPREIIDHEVNGLLVSPESLAGLSAALLRLATDDDLRTRLGAGALASAAQYDATAIARRWVAVFEEAIERRAGRSRFAALSAPRTETTQVHATLRFEGTEIAQTSPAQARRTALEVAVAAAGATDRTWFLIPPHDQDAARVVVPTEGRKRFLAALGSGAAPRYLSGREPAHGGWHERRAPLPDAAADLARGRGQVLVIEPWPTDADGRAHHLGQGCSVEVEFWDRAADGDLVAPRANPFAQRLPDDLQTVETDIDGLRVPTLAGMDAPTASECAFPIDVVYTWVDGDDPTWNAAREQRLAALAGTSTTRESSGQARFVSRNELRYSLRSIEMFAPWVRRIHLVTAGQVPPWLDGDHPRINLVPHEAILPADGLPTFNSHAIETSLHRIPDLAEHFVYFNDDFFLGRPVRPEHFFGPAGQTAVILAPSTIGLAETDSAPPYLKAAWNNRRLLQEAFGKVITHNLAHTPYPHRRSVLEEITERFPDAMAATARSPFRSDTDVSTLSSLAQHYGLMTGTAHLVDLPRAYINVANSDLDWHLKRALRREQDFLCLADHHDHALKAARLDATLVSFMTEYFPVTAPWERTP